MSEYIGSRISLISKSDIRYVGTLIKINSEDSTVALQDVRSFGTEGRRSVEGEIPPSDSIFEHIIFRGSDVKDLRIEETPKETKPAPPSVPNDPAILRSTRPSYQKQPPQPGPPPPHGPGFPQQSPFDQYPPFPPNQAFGRGFPGAPGFGGFPGMPYGGVPPGWYPSPGQAFPPHTAFSGQPLQAPGSASQQQQGGKVPQPPTQLAGAVQDEKPDVITHKSQPQHVAPKHPSPATAPPPPVESKPTVSAALAPAQAAPPQSNKPPTQPKGRVVPAVPLPVKPTGPATSTTVTSTTTVQTVSTAPGATQQYQSATEAATAAVAAAMAKLPGRQKQDTPEAMDNLTRRVNEMRADDNAKHARQQGTGGYVAGHRGGRGGRRGSFREHANAKPIEIPTTDFDFQSSNAKFNKQGLAKEVVTSGSSVSTAKSNGSEEIVATNGDAVNGARRAKDDEDVVIPPGQAVYDKKSSFFDNISSELKDRDEATRKKVGGPDFRSEERKKNMETFGQGSVDNYRGGYRGRGRRGYRGRGGFGGRNRGGYRGGRGAAQGTPTRTSTATVEASGGS